ncbi:MAG TPA: glycosyltransferase family A protein [Candidatus Paceibacterota bacterium]|nr:glycosyltransferase family A protein [Verrucomicrobiota bacterium]HSA10048.1 glycosyltransferase family A protein [Candidatus Paceibacterota bacterium]
MPNPTVSFVVPCYKLAHLLPECVNSILGQTYGDFEVLIMDDCSPDNTAEVARSFQDPRVKHVRNDPNLGALANYNKGIKLSRGRYVWLISADDILRRPYVLQRFVNLMDANPGIGYAFCPGVGLKNGIETGLIDYSTYGHCDRVVAGRTFLHKLIEYDVVLTAGAMARRECYEKISYFPINPAWAPVPIDLCWCGDWYLWCAFALHYDVGYLAEPMVCYRDHDLALTVTVAKQKILNCFFTEVAMRRKIKQEAEAVGCGTVSRKCLDWMAIDYARHLTGKDYRSYMSKITFEMFEESLCWNIADERERTRVRSRTYSEVADHCFDSGDLGQAKQFYSRALKQDPWMVKARVKRLLLSLGRPGEIVRRRLRACV